MNYDAELKEVVYMNGSLYGTIYGDKKGRFDDGTQVHTSLVLDVEEVTNGEIYQTRNSRYLVRD